jgi:hypothetical protein
MKTTPCFLSGLNRFLLLAGLCSLLSAPLSRSMADDADPAAAALAAARGWVGQIDAAKYDESYAAGCEDFRNKEKLEKWTMVLQTIRGIYGDVVSRKEASHSYKPNGYDGLDGPCMVVIFNTEFKKLPNAAEVVILKLEDGKWRGGGYTAGQKADSDSAPVQAVPQTEMESHTTQKPSQ